MCALSAVNCRSTRHGLKSTHLARWDFSPRTTVRRQFIAAIPYNKKRPLRPGRILGRSRRCAPWYHPPFHQYPPQQAHTGERMAITAIRLLLRPAIGGPPWRLHTLFGCAVRVFSRRLRSELQRLARLPWLSVAGHDSLSGARPLTLSVLAYSASSIVLLAASATRRCRAASKSITLPAMAALSDSTLFHIGM